MADPRPNTPNIAVFADFENVALGVRDARYPAFDWSLVLARLLDKGKIIFKRAYCDWERFKSAKKGLHEAGFELVEVPHVSYSGKNSADIRMVVDALDLCYQKQHVDIFVLVTGDSDFSPLVAKLRENDKLVVGLGVKNSTSNLLMESCDEFIFYDDLVARSSKRSRRRRGGSGRSGRGTSNGKDTPAAGSNDEAEAPAETALDWVMDTAEALFDEHDTVWGSMVKQTLKRKKPDFNEGAHGYRGFNALLEDAAAKGLMSLEKDERSGGYRILSVSTES
jgi:uncharacterized protein (TIGR00288 family)